MAQDRNDHPRRQEYGLSGCGTSGTPGMARGVEAHRIVRAARMLQGYELMFWDTLYALSTEEA
jgi:hypothetical protein